MCTAGPAAGDWGPFNLPHKNRHASLIGHFLRAIPIPPLFGGFFFLCCSLFVLILSVCLSVFFFWRDEEGKLVDRLVDRSWDQLRPASFLFTSLGVFVPLLLRMH